VIIRDIRGQTVFISVFGSTYRAATARRQHPAVSDSAIAFIDMKKDY
jgi:hypothetical protein